MNQTLFHMELDSILEDVELLKKKTQLVLDNRDLFDWNTIIPFDTYMYMFQAHIYPETRVNSSKYSALIMPPQLPEFVKSE